MKVETLPVAVLTQSVNAVTSVAVVQIFTILTGRWRTTVTVYRPFFDGSLVQLNTRLGFCDSCWPINKLLGRTEMRIRERKDRQSIRTVSDISLDDRARIAPCSLQTATDGFKGNYSNNNFYLENLSRRNSVQGCLQLVHWLLYIQKR